MSKLGASGAYVPARLLLYNIGHGWLCPTLVGNVGMIWTDV